MLYAACAVGLFVVLMLFAGLIARTRSQPEALKRYVAARRSAADWVDASAARIRGYGNQVLGRAGKDAG